MEDEHAIKCHLIRPTHAIRAQSVPNRRNNSEAGISKAIKYIFRHLASVFGAEFAYVEARDNDRVMMIGTTYT